MGISYPSIMAALAAMDDVDFQTESRDRNTEAREYVTSHLTKRGYDYVPSVTSFVLFPIEMEGEPFLKQMLDQGVGVRSFRIYGKNWCRVSMGTMDEMKTFVNALDTVLS
jgi:histidinol-phosphate aminotransferase